MLMIHEIRMERYVLLMFSNLRTFFLSLVEREARMFMQDSFYVLIVDSLPIFKILDSIQSLPLLSLTSVQYCLDNFKWLNLNSRMLIEKSQTRFFLSNFETIIFFSDPTMLQITGYVVLKPYT